LKKEPIQEIPKKESKKAGKKGSKKESKKEPKVNKEDIKTQIQSRKEDVQDSKASKSKPPSAKTSAKDKKKPKTTSRGSIANKNSRSTGGLCHYCSNIVKDKDSIKCSRRNCGKRYCQHCITDNLEKNVNLNHLSPSSWTCYSCRNCCSCANCLKGKEKDKNSGQKVTGFKRKLKDYGSRTEEDAEFGANPTKHLKTGNDEDNVKKPIKAEPSDSQKPKKRGRTKKSKDLVSEEISAPERGNTANISKFISRKEKFEINTTVNTITTSNGAQSGGSVKIITEIKSDEFQLTIFDAENVEELKMLESGNLK